MTPGESTARFLAKPEIASAHVAFETGLRNAGAIYGTEAVIEAFTSGMVTAYIAGMEDAVSSREQRTGEETV